MINILPYSFFVKYESLDINESKEIFTIDKVKDEITLIKLNINNKVIIRLQLIDGRAYNEILFDNYVIERIDVGNKEFCDKRFFYYIDSVITNILREDNHYPLLKVDNSFIKNLFIYYKSKTRDIHNMYLIDEEYFYLIVNVRADYYRFLCIDKDEIEEELSTFLLFFQKKLFDLHINNIQEYDFCMIYEEFIILINQNIGIYNYKIKKIEKNLEKLLLKII